MENIKVRKSDDVLPSFFDTVVQVIDSAPEYLNKRLNGRVSLWLKVAETEKETAQFSIEPDFSLFFPRPPFAVIDCPQKPFYDRQPYEFSIPVQINHELMHALDILYDYNKGPLSKHPKFLRIVGREIRKSKKSQKATVPTSAEKMIKHINRGNLHDAAYEMFAEYGRITNIKITNGAVTQEHDKALWAHYPDAAKWVERRISKITAAEYPNRLLLGRLSLSRIFHSLMTKVSGRLSPQM